MRVFRPATTWLFVLFACAVARAAAPSGRLLPQEPSAASYHQVQAGRCGACHTLPAGFGNVLQPTPARPLASLAARRGDAELAAWLEQHHAGRADARDVAAFVRSLQPAASRQAAEVPAGAIERGGQLFTELACRACHEPADFELAQRYDHAGLRAFLATPQVAQPGLAHVPMSAAEASYVAAWLLRQQRQDGATTPGFAYRYYELPIDDGDVPDLGAAAPVARGVVDRIDTAPAKRKQNYALEFVASIDVPAAGEWTFATSSDDGSWLWLDGRLVVDNAGLKPTRRREGRLQLAAGPHQLRVVFTQAGGGASLAVTWAGPGVRQQPLPGDRATASMVRLVPTPLAATTPKDDAAARGRLAARRRRCDACHAVDDAAFGALPAPSQPPRWTELTDAAGAGACAVPAAAEVFGRARGALVAAPSAALRLELSMQRDGCTSCHRRDTHEGLSASVRERLVEVEDLGEEGVLPPDLSSVGRRLRKQWLTRVVAEGHKVRDYVRVRMPAYGAERAAHYAELFAAVDAPGLVDQEVAFSADAATFGRDLAGVSGRNCISCHRVAGHASLGPQGMDLTLQHRRLRPGWMREWLLHPTQLRPNTRMPALWPAGAPADLEQIDALRAWMSLGAAAPLPRGLKSDANSLVLEPIDRPILHGAFLKDVSARCLMVGTPERTHFAFDLANPRLVWLWRGGFVDARGTWFGRAGQLIEPLDKAGWKVLEDFSTAGDSSRRLLGQRRTEDGLPVLRVRAGNGAVYEDLVRARLAAGGSEVVRQLVCTEGSLVLQFTPQQGLEVLVDGKPAGRHELAAGQMLEVVYRW